MADLTNVIELTTATHSGMVRSHNEDSIGADASIGLAVLADGMGGYNAGEVASGIAVAMISAEMKKALAGVGDNFDAAAAERLVSENAVRANSAIFQAAQNQAQYAGMGTTLVVALWHDNNMIVGHVGDSRLYRFRGGNLEQITRDHSLLQEQIDSGLITKAQARHSQNKNLVTRAVGIDPDVEPEVHSYPVQVGDIYLLCSDGLNDMVSDEDMQLTLSSLQANLPLAAEQLVQQANDNGGRDNVSVILVRVLKSFPARSGFVDRLKSWFK
ncbi:MAG: Stp1/IreP family PP2C-type Ser/Thr phosphatase [Betaproteobacteria bacterium]|jgi:serine/threonine protein phosphatase PrpC|nr:Stp1/IreP family PP2C-type Ser/Thr phosphatase [Betaproteobacteria bacterium]MDH5342831.1 Stp1/IreP family PP2C-type Ser/Thr phosphatase [Betaproteobacteria bacterium]